jgi:hypothetical protein
MSKIIGYCGAKGSGKDSAANFTAGFVLAKKDIIEDFWIDEHGKICDKDNEVIDCNSMDQNEVKIYHFADTLKEFCINVFDLPANLVYGSQQDKESLTGIQWDDMPNVITHRTTYQQLKRFVDRKNKLSYEFKLDKFFVYHEPGYMSIRDILQFFGTEICRNIHSTCWINAVANYINRDNPKLAIVADCRFDNEAQFIKDADGYCIRLMRSQHQDSHASENGFKEFNKWTGSIDNRNNSLKEFSTQVFYTVQSLGLTSL